MTRSFNYSFLLLFTLLVLGCTQSPEELFKNLSFQEPCPSMESGVCFWDISYQNKSDIAPFAEDDGNITLMIANEDGVGYVEQTQQLGNHHEASIITFTANIRTEDVSGNGAGLTIAIYDDHDQLIQNASMGYSNFGAVKGTTSWSPYEIQAFIPKAAKNIRVGLINYGKGTAYFDAARVKIVPVKDRIPSALARSYIQTALDSIRLHSLRKDSIDFNDLESIAYKIAGNAKEMEDVHLAIRYLLKAIGDHHSFFMTSGEHAKWSEPDLAALEMKFPRSRVIEGMGYLHVPGFHNNDTDLKKRFADTLQTHINKLYQKGISGWIVDLRDNDGGNMYPMLAGLEPLFSQDTLGGLKSVDGAIEYWGRGEQFEKEAPEDYVVSETGFVPKTDLPIAVLYNERTGSSGEILIISFIGNTKTRSFGRPSYGLTTGNSMYKMPDGSYLFLAATQMMDRNGRVYQGRVSPDELAGPPGTEMDSTLIAAKRWLKKATKE